MRTRLLPYALLALIAVTACKSSEGGGDASATTCGDAVCPAGVLCVSVQQNCGALTCDPVPDGGCPAGTSATPSCPDGGPPGCIQGCPEAQFSCEDKPAGCDPLACSCAAALCAPGTCLTTMGARVACRAP
jgi:hypothetical protein